MIKQLFWVELVGLIIKKDSLRRFGDDESKDDAKCVIWNLMYKTEEILG